MERTAATKEQWQPPYDALVSSPLSGSVFGLRLRLKEWLLVHESGHGSGCVGGQ